MDAFVSVTAGTLAPAEFFASENIGPLLGRSESDAVTESAAGATVFRDLTGRVR
jgi:hypothetical protein